MLVIHPSDPSTAFLTGLYAGLSDVTCLTGGESRNCLTSFLFHRPVGEPLMLLGHGTDAGLFRLDEDGEYRRYVGRSMAYCLRKHPIIGIWCHANLFANEMHLHGLFSGMIVSEMDEAEEYGITCTPEELARENEKFVQNLKRILDSGVPLFSVPAAMRSLGCRESELEWFNYNSLYYL